MAGYYTLFGILILVLIEQAFIFHMAMGLQDAREMCGFVNGDLRSGILNGALKLAVELAVAFSIVGRVHDNAGLWD